MNKSHNISKIDFIITAFSGGGAERVMAILINAFFIRNYKITLITFNESVEGEDSYPINEEVNRIKLHGGRFKNHNLRSLNNLLGYYKNKAKRPDVIISFLTSTNIISILAARAYGIKIIASEHTNCVNISHPKFLTKFTRNYIYRLSNFITVLTQYDVSYYKKKGSNVFVMPNPNTFVPINFNSHKRNKEMLVVGNLNRYVNKGFDKLLTLLPELFIQFPEWKLKVIGGGQKGEIALNSQAKQLGIDDKVILTGFQDNVADHMRKASLFILCSKFEGLPMALLEAMSQGMACISYNCLTGPSDIIENGVNGLLIQDQNIEEMKFGLETLIENSELRSELAKNGLESLEKFSLETIIAKWEQLFNRI